MRLWFCAPSMKSRLTCHRAVSPKITPYRGLLICCLLRYLVASHSALSLNSGIVTLTLLQSTYNSSKDFKDSPNSGQVLKLFDLRDLRNNIDDALNEGNQMVNICSNNSPMCWKRRTIGHNLYYKFRRLDQPRTRNTNHTQLKKYIYGYEKLTIS